MELKTKVNAEDGRQDLHITREFDLPLELLFKAYTEPELVAQWMGTQVLTLESKKHGSYRFETKNEQGQIVFKASGVIHDMVPNEKIIRTFEIENTPFPVQLEFLAFQSLTTDKSLLTIHIIYRSEEERNQVLKLPFAYGMSMAHNRLENMLHNLK